MKFVEMTGKSLAALVRDDEINGKDLQKAGVTDDCVVRINEQGDIELRRPRGWDVIGGLLGDYQPAFAEKPGWNGLELRAYHLPISIAHTREVPARLVAAAVFKTVGSYVKHAIGGFDSHALPPIFFHSESVGR